MSATLAAVRPPEAPARQASRLSDFLALTKPRITLLVTFSTLVGFQVASRGAMDLWLLVHTLLGTALVSGAASALNQWAERAEDGEMRRTAGRPLPAGRLRSSQAAWFGLAMGVLGAAWLAALASLLAGFLAVLTALSYVAVYTPLKKRTSLSTVIGAVPGAIPPLIGWAAVRGDLSLVAWALFGIVFLWQMPHFLAIATLLRQDYERAGFRVLPVLEPDGASTGRQSTLYALALVPVSLLPAVAGVAGEVYFAGALALSACLFALSAGLALRPGDLHRARRLFRFSLVYLPAIWLLLILG